MSTERRDGTRIAETDVILSEYFVKHRGRFVKCCELLLSFYKMSRLTNWKTLDTYIL